MRAIVSEQTTEVWTGSGAHSSTHHVVKCPTCKRETRFWFDNSGTATITACAHYRGVEDGARGMVFRFLLTGPAIAPVALADATGQP